MSLDYSLREKLITVLPLVILLLFIKGQSYRGKVKFFTGLLKNLSPISDSLIISLFFIY